MTDKPVENLFQRTLVSRAFPIWARYSITTMLVALAAWVKLAGGFGRYPFLLFFPVIILSGVVFGRGTSFFATLLSATIAAYYFLSPESSLGVERAQAREGVADQRSLCMVTQCQARFKKRWTPSIPLSFHSASSSGGPTKSSYMRNESQPNS